ncbi:hypothetical protein JTB14_027351 [Gonioctena quinquepunctata]|nr:hypothetical protein JTB14_027351 [Gonioctena quinquepunctata]
MVLQTCFKQTEDFKKKQEVERESKITEITIFQNFSSRGAGRLGSRRRLHGAAGTQGLAGGGSANRPFNTAPTGHAQEAISVHTCGRTQRRVSQEYRQALLEGSRQEEASGAALGETTGRDFHKSKQRRPFVGLARRIRRDLACVAL